MAKREYSTAELDAMVDKMVPRDREFYILCLPDRPRLVSIPADTPDDEVSAALSRAVRSI
jgi:hypothetical protein